MKILYISHDDGKYGAAQSLIKLIDILKSNYDVIPIVITRCYNEINEFCTDNQIENIVLPYVNCITYNYNKGIKREFIRSIQNLKNKLFNKISLFLLRRKVDVSTINAIHSNISTLDFGAYISKKYKIPHFWHVREFGDLDINCCPASNSYYYIMNESTKIFAISNAIKQHWIDKGINRNKIVTIYNGIDPLLYKFKENSFSKKGLKIIFMGSSSPHKGLIQLINAMKILKEKRYLDINIDVYGDYENKYGQKLKEIVQKNDLIRHINFLGYSNDMSKIINSYDIGIVCSKAEGFGRVTVEYMMSGIVVIASNTGANPEIIDNYDSGLLYNYGDIEDLANKIELLHNNNKLLKKLALNGYEKAINEYTAEKNAEKIYKYYLENLLDIN